MNYNRLYHGASRLSNPSLYAEVASMNLDRDELAASRAAKSLNRDSDRRQGSSDVPKLMQIAPS